MKINHGFTLLELLITMALVMIVIGITGSAFNSILKSTGRLVSSEESNIEGVVGLEMFRHDLQQTGLGLPYVFSDPAPSYAEATVGPANLMNDGRGTAASPLAGNVPRAIASWNDLTGASTATSDENGAVYNVLSGTDYLAIKATSVGTSSAARKWTYLSYSAGGKHAKSWPNAEDNLVASDDRVIVLNRTYSPTGALTNSLVYVPATPGTYWVNYTNGLFSSDYSPVNPQQIYYLYGIAKNTDLIMPFNRADYFVSMPSDRSKIPASCAKDSAGNPNTGILYKTQINHGSTSGTKTGKLTYMPVLDCVADMQVVFGWDLNGNGVIEESSAYESDPDKISVSGSTITRASIKTVMESAEEIRNKLKYIKVYVMAQEGRKDSNFTNAAPINVGDPTNIGLTKTYSVSDLTAKGWLNYHWKIYRIVVRPKNIITN